MTVLRTLHLSPALRRAIVRQARSASPRECCGFLVGYDGRVERLVPMQNRARGTRRYRIDPRAHITLRRSLRALRPAPTILGVYHSHPRGQAMPSPTDVAEALYPEWVHVIVGLGGSRATMRAFAIREGRVDPVAIERISSLVHAATHV